MVESEPEALLRVTRTGDLDWVTRPPAHPARALLSTPRIASSRAPHMAGAVLSAFLIWQVGSVAFRTVAGTATAGLDFVATEGYVNFAAGQTVAEVSVTIIDDDEEEDDETFSVELRAEEMTPGVNARCEHTLSHTALTVTLCYIRLPMACVRCGAWSLLHVRGDDPRRRTLIAPLIASLIASLIVMSDCVAHCVR